MNAVVTFKTGGEKLAGVYERPEDFMMRYLEVYPDYDIPVATDEPELTPEEIATAEAVRRRWKNNPEQFSPAAG